MASSDHERSYVCVHVFEASRPVLLVSRAGGDWQFLCGGEHEDRAENCRVVGKVHLLGRDPSLKELSDLAPEWEAERSSPGGVWVRRPVA